MKTIAKLVLSLMLMLSPIVGRAIPVSAFTNTPTLGSNFLFLISVPTNGVSPGSPPTNFNISFGQLQTLFSASSNAPPSFSVSNLFAASAFITNYLTAGSITNGAGAASRIAVYDSHTPPGLISLANGGANTFLQGTTPPSYTGITDAALSGNVPLINAQNNFSGSNFINSTIGFVQAMLSTNAWANGPTGGIDFAAGGYQEYKITSGNCAITGIANKPSALMPFVELMLTNSTGSDSTVFYTGAITTDDGARSWVVTNKTARSVWIRYAPSGLTNASSRPWF